MRIQCATCYGEAPEHEGWCPIPSLPEHPTPADAVSAVVALAEINPDRAPSRAWSAALGAAMELGRRLAREADSPDSECPRCDLGMDSTRYSCTCESSDVETRKGDGE